MTVVRYRGATRRLVLALMMLGAPCAVAQQSADIPGVISPGGEPELVQEGFTFTEGPVGTPDGGLYFTDIRASRIHRLDAVGKITTLHEQTNGANGLALNKAGELFAAEGGGKRISMRNRDSAPMVLTDNVEGKPFLAPNDLILDSKGGIYFTDPGPRPVVAGRPTCLCYLPAGAKQATVLDATVGRPNGLILTVDGKTLIVTDTIGNTVFAYDVQPDGTVKGKRAFAELRDIPAGKESGADGLALDDRDRVYITTRAGVQVFDAKGDYLGTIKLGRWPANVAFAGPDRQTLYITAREGLYRVKMLSRGPDRPGK